MSVSGFEQLRRERFYAVGDQGDRRDQRSEFRHDRDRILYCSAFRRLSGITQVISPSGSHPTHNRLTHSLEVAQIARSIGERLLDEHPREAFEEVGGLDVDVVEAAALAHDLGHPPFGHVAESALNSLMDSESDSREGFEGNAQSFRILTNLATRYPDIPGLNLTRATLSAATKYPWTRHNVGVKSRKWGAYDADEATLRWSREHLPGALRERKTIEAEIMDYADDVAYAVHDLEDFYRAGMVPLDRLRNDSEERQRFLERHLSRPPERDPAQLASILSEIAVLFPAKPYDSTQLSKATLRSFTSGFVNRYIVSFDYDPGTHQGFVPDHIRAEVELLKGLTWHYVIDSRALLTTRHGYASVIRSLFAILSRATASDDNGMMADLGIFPEFYREQLERGNFSKEAIARTVSDTIASLTEAQAIRLHQRLSGQSLGAVLDPIL